MGADASSPLNVLLITSDQQRADTIGALNPAIRTPQLDRLARQGGILDLRGAVDRFGRQIERITHV